MADVGVARRDDSRRIAPRRIDPRRLEVRGIAAYVAIVFGLTWTVQIAALARGVRFGGASLLDTTPTAIYVLLLSMAMPALGAVIVRQFVTREGFADAGLRLGPKRYYLWVWLGVPALFALTYAVTLALGAGTWDPGASAIREMLAQAMPEAADQQVDTTTMVLTTLAISMTVGLLITSIATFGEEFGWTGYLLPRLLPLGKWAAAVIYGAIWGLWHAPAIWGGFNYPTHPALGIGMMMLFTISLALGMTALRLRSGSILLTAFAHAAINTQGRGVATILTRDIEPLVGGALGVIGIGIFAIAGAMLLARTPLRALDVPSAPVTSGPPR